MAFLPPKIGLGYAICLLHLVNLTIRKFVIGYIFSVNKKFCNFISFAVKIAKAKLSRISIFLGD